MDGSQYKRGSNIHSLQIMQGLKLVDFPRLREFFRGVISLMEVDAAFLTKENSPLSNRITQQVILRALGLKLDAVFKAKYPSEEGKGSDDYKVFYERMLGGLEGLKNQGEKNSLPNLVGSVVQIYTNSLNSAFGKNLRLDLKSLQTSLSTNFQTNPNYYQIYISQIPKIEPSQA